MKKSSWVQDTDKWEAEILVGKACAELAKTGYPGQYRVGPSKAGLPGQVGVYFHDFSDEPRPSRGTCEATRDPIFVLIRRTVICGDFSCKESDPSIERCHVCMDKIITEEPEAVFLSREEGEAFGNARKHNFGEMCHTPDNPIMPTPGTSIPTETGKGWYVYCIPAEGSLATLLNDHARRED